MKFDRGAGEAQILGEAFPRLKDHWAYASCLFLGMHSHWRRRDKSRFLRDLQAHERIDLNKTTSNLVGVVSLEINIVSCCFDLGVWEEGFAIVRKVNSIGLTPKELGNLKSPEIVEELRNIIQQGSTSNAIPQLQLLI